MSFRPQPASPLFRAPTAEELAGILEHDPRVPKPRQRRRDVPRERDYARALLSEYASRMYDGCRLYRALPAAEPFHASRSRKRLLVGANQSSKTQSAVMETVRIARGLDPYKKRPQGSQRIVSVGPDSDFLADVLWPKIGWAGAYMIVPDEQTGFWRSVRPDPADPRHLDPIDLAREAEWLPAPPILPPHDIVGGEPVWAAKNKGVPKKLKIRSTGSDWVFYSAESNAKRGDQWDMLHVSEEVENTKWIHEGMARLLRRDGIFLWDFTPQAATIEALRMHRRVQTGAADIEEFTFTLWDNPYVADSAKQELERSCLSEEERMIRVYGKWAILGRQVYPEFNLELQGIAPFAIPADWMKVMVTDPGWQTCAVAFAAIPPAADEIHLFDELYLHNVKPDEYAQACRTIIGEEVYEAWVVDRQYGQQTQVSSGYTVAEHLELALAEAELVNRLGASKFQWGSGDTHGRTGSLKRWLIPDGAGRCRLQIHRGKCPNFEREMPQQFYKKDRPNERDNRQDDHMVDCLEYLAAFFDAAGGLYYYPPLPPTSAPLDDFASRMLADKLKMAQQRRV